MYMHDVDGNTVKLNYNALVRTAEIAYGQLLQKVSSCLDKAYYMKPDDLTGLHLNASDLSQIAEKFKLVAETLSALKYGLKREIVILTNRIVTKDEQ
jgi:hypothetical protein